MQEVRGSLMRTSTARTQLIRALGTGYTEDPVPLQAKTPPIAGGTKWISPATQKWDHPTFL